MPPYLTNAQIQARLSTRFSVSATITAGDADIASAELDAAGPFIGEKQSTTQERAFPRSLNPDGSENTDPAIPEPVLDWVALRAFQLSEDEAPAVTSESALGFRASYANPKLSQSQARMIRLLAPYQRESAGDSVWEVASTFAGEDQ